MNGDRSRLLVGFLPFGNERLSLEVQDLLFFRKTRDPEPVDCVFVNDREASNSRRIFHFQGLLRSMKSGFRRKDEQNAGCNDTSADEN